MQARGFATDGVVDTLDAVSRLHAVRTDADAGLFELAAHFADQHAGESLATTHSSAILPGLERSVQVGGAGTPVVAEFAFAELGARMQMSPFSARRLVADALDVQHRFPLIWERVVRREARVSNARLVAARTRHLSVEAAAFVDAAMVDFVDGSLPWGRFEARLVGKVVAADPDTAAEREEAAAAEQFARRSRSSEQGMAGFYLRSTVGVVARVEASVAFLAEALAAFGDGDNEDVRRVKAMVVLANPARAVELLAAFAALRARTVDEPLDLPGGLQSDQPQDDPLTRMDTFARRVGFTPTRLPTCLLAESRDDEAAGFSFDWADLLPSLTLYLHLSTEDLARGEGGVVRWEGEGPVTHQFVNEHLRPLHRYVITPVVDLANQAPVDAYEIPDRLRRAVHLRTPADTFPYSSNLSRGVDLDHTVEHASEGETRAGNLGPLGRHAHRVKTHGRWTVRQPFDGIYLWRDPHGQLYLVDHTGTHAVGAASAYDPEIDLWPTDTVVQFDFEAG
jgi:hypothetical protein